MIADAIATFLPDLRAEAEALMVDSCVRRRYTDGAADEFGNPAKVASDVTLTCRKRPVQGDEATTDQDIQSHEAEFHFPYDADVAGDDELIHDGTTWQVIGPPLTQTWPVRLRVVARRTLAV